MLKRPTASVNVQTSSTSGNVHQKRPVHDTTGSRKLNRGKESLPSNDGSFDIHLVKIYLKLCIRSREDEDARRDEKDEI